VADKIFIDLDEEIIFIIEKLKEIENEKVILIVPERAALLGSIVSLKLLFSEVVKAGKKVVIVTKDEVGLRLASKADFVTVEKVSQITDETWDRVSELQKKYKSKNDMLKDSLVSERKEHKEMEAEIEKQNSSNITPLGSLKKISPKKVNIDGFEMVSGGDISKVDFSGDENLDKAEIDKVHSSNLKENIMNDESSKDKDLIGKDLSTFSYTSMAGSKQEGKEKESVGSRVTSVLESIKSFFSKGGTRQKVIIAFGIILIGFFILSYFILPKASVTINIESEDIEIEKAIIADTQVNELDIESLTIPAEVIEVQRDRSDSAAATGVTETGETASGEVTLYNLTENEVRISANTTLESIETGLRYKTVTEVTVPAKKSEDDPTSPGLIGTVDVGVSAESFGENYNLSAKERFRVEGFDLENLYGKNFNNITGGTTEQRKTVSQEDYDNLKQNLEEQLKQDLVTALQSEAGSSKELLSDTIEYETINEDASPGVDAQAETFNLSVTVKATALSFSSEDIDTLAEQLVTEENEDHVEVEEFDYNCEVLSSEESKINLNLIITGVVTPSINSDEVRTNLINKSKDAGELYLDTQERIESYEVYLYPKWLPSFLKHFPSSPNRIEVQIEKV